MIQSKYNLIILFCCLFNVSYGQGLTIQNGSHLKANGNAAIVVNDGSFTNNGIFNSGTGTLYMKGSVVDSNSTIGGTTYTEFANIVIDKNNNGIQLASNISILSGDLHMTNGTLNLNGKDIFFYFGTNILNETETNRIWGDSGTVVSQTNLNAPTNINPANIGLTISSSDNLGTFLIRRIHQAPSLNGSSGMNRQYKVEYINTGLTLDYSMAYFENELNGHNEAWIEPWSYDSNWSQRSATAIDTVANTISITGATENDTLWAFADGKLQVTPKVILQGNYLSGGLMSDNLRANSLIPTTEPYTGLGYTHVNAGGESVNSSVFTVTGNDAIVDWVFLEVRDPLDSTSVKQTVSTLLQKDGDIVDLDGVSPVSIPNLGNDNYYIAIRHRNHLPIRSATKLAITPDNSSYDFSSALTQAWDKTTVTTNDAMTDLGSGVFGMISGDINGNQNIRATGPPFINDFSSLLSTLGGGTNILTNQYHRADLNMDGTIRATGPPFINDFSKLLSFLGTSTTILNAHID